MEIKVTVTLDPRACEVLTKLADALSKEIKVTAVATPELTEKVVQHDTDEPTPEEYAEALEEAAKAQEKAESQEVKETPQKKEEAPQSQKTEPVRPTITDEELRLVAAETKEYFKSTEYVKKALQCAGAKKISEVPAHKRQDFIDYLKKVMADEIPF
jgi:hypothetical protein